MNFDFGPKFKVFFKFIKGVNLGCGPFRWQFGIFLIVLSEYFPDFSLQIIWVTLIWVTPTLLMMLFGWAVTIVNLSLRVHVPSHTSTVIVITKGADG